MRIAKWIAGSLGVALLVLLPSLTGRTEEAADDASAFTADLAKIEKELERGHWKKGLEKIQELLARHPERDYARAKRVELEDLVQRCAFRSAYPAPEPQEVLSGRLRRCELKSGNITIEYAPDTIGDFKKGQGGLLEHPARFVGAFSVEIHGHPYPERVDDSPQVIVGGVVHPKTGRPQTWQIVCGVPPRSAGGREIYLPARIIHHDGDDTEVVSTKEKSPGRPGKPYRIVVKVGAKRITAALNGKSLGSASKSNQVFGGVAFKAADWDKATLSGKVEPSWIQHKLDKITQKQLKEFRRKFKREDYLPTWLFETPASTPSRAPTRRPPFPGNPTRAQRASLQEIADRIDDGEVLPALVRLESEDAGKLPEAARHYLAARAWVLLYQLDGARESIERSLALAPEFLDGSLLHARILDRLGEHEKAGQIHRDNLEKHPQEASAYHQAAIHHLVAESLPEAKKVTELAVSRGIRDKDLDALGRALVVMDNGPAWGKVHEYTSANYHIVSDIDRATCVEAARLLEEAYTSYRANIEYVRGDRTRKFKVYLFSGQAGFARFMKDLGPLGGDIPANVAGLYSPLLKQLLIWNLPQRDAMMETVRHEGFHQYLDRFMAHPPVWFNEGLAVYYEHAPRVGGRLKPGRVQPEYVSVLKQMKLMPLERFLFLPHRAFYQGGIPAYAQAWALIHMMRHGKQRHRDVFRKLMEGLQSDAPSDTLAELFTAERIKELQSDLEAYVAKLIE